MDSNNIFTFGMHNIRTIMKNDEPWFVAKDVAEVLGYEEPHKAIAKHCKSPELLKGDEASLLTTSPRGINIIPERDVYRLVMRSKLPAAERFEEWVVSEVLPQLRKKGSYTTEQPIAPPQIDNTNLIQAVQAMQMFCGAVLDQLGTKSLIASPVQKADSNYSSVGAFIETLGKTPDQNTHAIIGNKALAVLRLQDLKPAKGRWKYQRVNIYPVSVLHQVYATI